MSKSFELTPEQMAFIASQLPREVASQFLYEGGKLYVPDEYIEQVEAIDLDNRNQVELNIAKVEAKIAMLVEADIMARTFKQNYTETEQQTWPKQEAEALAVDAGTLAAKDARFLLKLAKGDEALVSVLAVRVKAKAEFFEDVSVTLIQMRGDAEAAIDAATSLDELSQIKDYLKTTASAKVAELKAGA